MSDCSVSNALIKTDQFLDYIPFVSIVNNAVDLVLKVVLYIFSCILPRLYEQIEDNPWIDHLVNQKTKAQCILFAIPFLNTLAACMRDSPDSFASSNSEPEPQNAIVRQQQELRRQLDQQTRQAQAARERREAEDAARRAEEEAQQKRAREEARAVKLAGLDAQIAACPDTEAGRNQRGKLEIYKASLINNGSLPATQRMSLKEEETLSKLELQIIKCPDTEQGRKTREQLVSLRESVLEMYKSGEAVQNALNAWA